MARSWQKGSTVKNRRMVTRADGTTVEVVSYTGVFRDSAGARHKATFPSKAEVTAWLRKNIAEVSAGSYTAPAPDMTFKAFAEQWIEGRRASLKPAGIRTYLGRLGLGGNEDKRKAPSPVGAWAERKMSSLSTADMVKYFNQAHEAGLSRKTLTDTKTLLSSVFADAKESGHVGSNPIASRLLRLPRREQDDGKVQRETPSTATVNALLDHLQDRDPIPYTAVLMMCSVGGMRPGEAAGVQVGDLDRINRRIHIRRNIDPRADCEVVTTKTSKRRLADCGPQVFAAIDRLLAARFGDPRKAPADAWVLGGPDGKPFDMDDFRKGCSRRWPVLLVEAGVPHFPMYGCRHYFASRLLARGANPVWVAEQMGHSSARITLEVYAHALPTKAQERETDALVAELLPVRASMPWGDGLPLDDEELDRRALGTGHGDKSGTTAPGTRPGASASVEGGAVEVPKKSRNVERRRAGSTTVS